MVNRLVQAKPESPIKPSRLDGTDSAAAQPILPQASDARIKAAIGASMAVHLRVIWPALAGIYTVFAAAHFWLLEQDVRSTMVTLAATSAVMFGVAAVWTRRRAIAGPVATMLGGFTALVLCLNSVVHLFLLQDPWQTTNLAIVVIATAMLLLDPRWFFSIAALCAVAWLAAVNLLPGHPRWIHFGFALFSSEVVAVLIHVVRIRDLKHIEGLRVAEEERKLQLESALEVARLRLASIWQNSREGLVISDENGRVVAVNRAIARLVGIPEADLPGRRWIDLLSKEGDLEAAERAYVQAFSSPESVSAEEREVVLVDGRHTWLSTSHLRLPQPDGRHQLLTLVRDVTERRLLDEERLAIQSRTQEAQRMESLGVLAGGIAHDFNNLLTGITGNLELARALLPSESEACKSINQADTAAKRAAELCHQLLAYAGRGRFMIEELNLNDLIAETSVLLSASLPKMARLELDLAAGLPGLRADASQLRQVVMNLVINAAEAIGDRPGTIKVSTRTATADEAHFKDATVPVTSGGSWVCLEVRDDGCGMAPEIQARIFDPFYSTKFTGRGLGLSAVVGIVRGHNGGLFVESKPGRGSTFAIFFPALNRAAATVTPQRPRQPTWRGEGTVLIVDDEPFIRQLLQTLLEGLGFQVLSAANGAEGVEVMREQGASIRLILLDLTMPQMDGRRTLQALHELGSLPPVILMSGYTEVETHQRFADQGLSGFLQKPFTLDELADRVHRALENELRNDATTERQTR